MTRDEALTIADKALVREENNLVELYTQSFIDLTKARGDINYYFTVMEKTLKEYKLIQERIREARVQKNVINTID